MCGVRLSLPGAKKYVGLDYDDCVGCCFEGESLHWMNIDICVEILIPDSMWRAHVAYDTRM